MVSRKTVAEFKITSARCAFCVKADNIRCFCFPGVDSNKFEAMRETLISYIESVVDNGFRRLNEFSRKSKIVFVSSLFDATFNKLHIDDDPTFAGEQQTTTKC
jgi:hypothetical protein